MSKGSGGTRSSSWRDKQASPEAKAMKNVVAAIRASNDKGTTFHDTDGFEMNDWDKLSVAQKLQALEDGRFTGMWQGELMDSSADFRPGNKENIVKWMQDVLQNVKDGYDMEDENHYVFQLAGESKPIHSEDLTKPLTKTQISKIEWISGDYGMTDNYYWHKPKQAYKNDMIAYMGFHEFKSGKEIQAWNGAKLKDNASDY